MDFAPAFKKPDWSNLEVIHRNTLPPRASFFNFTSVEDALTLNREKFTSVSLSGTWKFNVYKCPYDLPKDPAESLLRSSQYGDIAVPGMWQLQDYGQGPRYTNMSLPFPVDPPHVPYFENETGHYITTFEIPESFKGQQIRLRFEGIDSAFHVYINENEVGYSQGARNPSEFDITEFVTPDSANVLSVVVYQFSDGTYLEDQVSLMSQRISAVPDTTIGSMVAKWHLP